MKEWGFDVDSDQVDLDRIVSELEGLGMVAITQKLYIEKLRAEAPVVYGRLKEYCIERGLLKWVSW